MKKYMHDFKNIYIIFKSQFKNYFKFIMLYLYKILILLGFAFCISWTLHTLQNIESIFSVFKILIGFIYIFFYFVSFSYNLSTSEEAEYFLTFINNIVFLVAVFAFVDKDLYPSLISFLKNNKTLNFFFIETNLVRIWLPSIYIYANSLSLFRKISGPLETPDLTNLQDLLVSILFKMNQKKFQKLYESSNYEHGTIEATNELTSKITKMNEILEEIDRDKTIEDIRKIIEDDAKTIEDLYRYMDKYF